MLTLYDYLPSQNAWKVRQLLAHLQLPHRTRLVSIFEVVFGVAMPLTEGGNPGSIAGGAVIAGAGLLVLGGIIVRRRGSRVAGDRMIVVGALPTLPWMWLILPPLAGLTLIMAAAVDAAEARSLGERPRRRTA